MIITTAMTPDVTRSNDLKTIEEGLRILEQDGDLKWMPFIWAVRRAAGLA